MKQNYFNLILLSVLAGVLTACGSSSTNSPSTQTKSSAVDVLFVCGGNTGRSPSAEALANANGLNAFSRASGLGASDSLDLESGAVIALSKFAESQHKSVDYYTKYILGRKAQQLTYEDVLRSAAIYPMTEAHMCRVALTIELNADSDIDAQQQFNKVHLLSSCATGKYSAVPDGFGVAESQEAVFYNGIIQQLNNYILAIKHNHNTCVVAIATESSPFNSSLDDTLDYCCSKYSSDLNKRYNNYCATQH